jgi:alpha-D-xyloside xylohydrolase
MMRPLWWDFPSDGSSPAWNTNDTFMLGPKYLAAPVLELGVRSRTVWLPICDGGWTHYYTGETFAGGATIHVNAPYDELPLFVRGGL